MRRVVVTGLLLLCLLALVFMAISVIARNLARDRAIRQLDLELQSAAPSAARVQSQRAADTSSTEPPADPTRFAVQLYDFGQIKVTKPQPAAPSPPEPKPKNVPKAKPPSPTPRPAPPAESHTPPAPSKTPMPTPAEPVVERAAPTPPAAPADTPIEDAEWPTLVIDFAAIGIERYVGLTERMGGAFFAFMKQPRGLGPRLALLERGVRGDRIDTTLATGRPHLVNDGAIGQLLAPIALPLGASRSSVVMIWSTWMDRLIWSEIESACAEAGLSIRDLTKVEGAYVAPQGHVFIRVDRLVRRHDGARLSVQRFIRLPA
jgi:hypothetical protein